MNKSIVFKLFLALLSSPLLSHCAASSSSAAPTPHYVGAIGDAPSIGDYTAILHRIPTNKEIERAYLKGNVKLLHAWMDTGDPELRARVIESAHCTLEPEFTISDFTNEDLRALYRIPQDPVGLKRTPEPEQPRPVDLAGMAKDAYLKTGTVPHWLAPYFEGVSVQDLIDHDKLPKIKMNSSRHLVLDLRRQQLNSLEGLGNIIGIEYLHTLLLQKNRFTHIERAHLTKLASIKKIISGANPQLTPESKKMLRQKCA